MQELSSETISEINDAMKPKVDTLFNQFKEIYRDIYINGNTNRQAELDLVIDQLEANGLHYTDKKFIDAEQEIISEEKSKAA